MKKYCIVLCVFLSTLFSCKKDPEPVDITGEWQLFSYQTKAVSIGAVKVDVYLKFESDGNFELYQFLGEGRYRKYSGNYMLKGNVLSGTYAGGSSWASDYEVSRDGSKLVLMQVPEGREVHTFSPTSIPASVTSNVY